MLAAQINEMIVVPLCAASLLERLRAGRCLRPQPRSAQSHRPHGCAVRQRMVLTSAHKHTRTHTTNAGSPSPLKSVLQLEGSGRLVPLRPPGGVGGPGARGGDGPTEDAGVRPAGESGRERLRSQHPHLHLLQPALLQPHRQGV